VLIVVDVFFRGFGTWKILGDDKFTWNPISDYDQASGYFSIADKDEEAYLLTQCFDYIDILRPSDHPNSAFSTMANEGGFDSQLKLTLYHKLLWKMRRCEFVSDPNETEQLRHESEKAEQLCLDLKAAEESHELEKVKQLNHELDNVEQRYYELEKAYEISKLAALAVFRIDKKKPYFSRPGEKCEPKTLKTTVTDTERGTMLKLILGMAMDGYRYIPNSSYNTATGNGKGSIKAGLQKVGLDADEKTISKYLKEATEHYPAAKSLKS
jgi:hypothetical protein